MQNRKIALTVSQSYCIIIINKTIRGGEAVKLIRYFKNVKHEMTIVRWPTFQENTRNTTIVIGLTTFFVGFFALGDWLIRMFVQWLV